MFVQGRPLNTKPKSHLSKKSGADKNTQSMGLFSTCSPAKNTGSSVCLWRIADARCPTSAGLMLGLRLRRWPNIKPALGVGIAFEGSAFQANLPVFSMACKRRGQGFFTFFPERAIQILESSQLISTTKNLIKLWNGLDKIIHIILQLTNVFKYDSCLQWIIVQCSKR